VLALGTLKVDFYFMKVGMLMCSHILGNKIAKLRKRKGLTQTQLANILVLTRKAVSRWETGAGMPDIAILPQLADVLDVTIDELLRKSIPK